MQVSAAAGDRLRLEVHAPGYVPVRGVVAGSSRAVEIWLERGELRVVRVRDGAGAPVDRAVIVRAHDGVALGVSEAVGAARVRVAPGTEPLVEVLAEGGRWASERLAADRDEQGGIRPTVITLREPLPLTVAVVDERQRPVPGAIATLDHQAPAAVTDAQGIARFAVRPGAVHHLAVGAGGFLPASASVTGTAGRVITLPVKEAASLAGAVVDAGCPRWLERRLHAAVWLPRLPRQLSLRGPAAG